MNLHSVSMAAWITLLSSIITAIALFMAFLHNNKQYKIQKAVLLKPYFDNLTTSLPSYDAILTKSDYLEYDNGIGTLIDASGKPKMLKQKTRTRSRRRLNYSQN